MKFVALLMAGDKTPEAMAPGLSRVGGISLLERQVRMVLKRGAATVFVVAPELPSDLAVRFARESRIVRVSGPVALAEQLPGDSTADSTPLLMLAPGMLIDDRLLAAVLGAAECPSLLTFGAEAPEGAERLDSTSHWAGAALLPAALVRDVAVRLGEWSLAGTLVRRAVEERAARLAVGDVPLYAINRRRIAPMLWALPRTDEERAAATDSLFAAAQKGCLDWPARFIHPLIENTVVRLILNFPISPNAITLLTAVLGFLAMWMFATGTLLPGLVLALVVGPLDGIDGKLARVRQEFSRWGDLEHVLDKILEYGWFLALAGWFYESEGAVAFLAAAGIILFALTEAVSGEFFRRFTGRQLDDWGPFERRFRLIGGRRNTFFWTLLPFGIMGAWWAGFLVILAYAAITFAVSHWRLLRALGVYGRRVSEEVRSNFARTAYDFLPKSNAEGS